MNFFITDTTIIPSPILAFFFFGFFILTVSDSVHNHKLSFSHTTDGSYRGNRAHTLKIIIHTVLLRKDFNLMRQPARRRTNRGQKLNKMLLAGSTGITVVRCSQSGMDRR